MRNPISDSGKFGLMAAREQSLTVERLREVLRYEPETGDFYRLVRGGKFLPGTKAGYLCVIHGYMKVGIDGRHFNAHRLAWLYVHGEWPKHSVDHINQDKADNRICNLRDVPMRENLRNQSKAHRHSKTGVIGVSIKGGRFRAQITVDGRKQYVGSFKTAEEAHAAYMAAKRVLHAACDV